MINQQTEQGMAGALKEVYGTKAEEHLTDLRKQHPKYTEEQLLRAFEQGPTCNYSFFLREQNIRGLSQMMSKETAQNWRVLDVGCGDGPEPYELAMRLVKEKKENFKIDGIDVSETAISKAREGKHTHSYPDYIRLNDETEFLQEMEKSGVLNNVGSKVVSQNAVINYELADSVKPHLSFSTHDIIDGPFQPRTQAPYNLTICNNVLLHYPAWTRELALLNMLENLSDGGVLALEHNEWLGGIGMTGERASWLAPYYEWKETLSRFGLQKEELKPEGSWMPLTIYRYDSKTNPYKGKTMAIRNMQLVEAKNDMSTSLSGSTIKSKLQTP